MLCELKQNPDDKARKKKLRITELKTLPSYQPIL